LIYRSLERSLKKLIGRSDIKDALQRLDDLMQEESRMAAAQGLKAIHGVDKGVGGIRNDVQGIGDRVSDVDDRVRGVGDKIDVVIDGARLVFTSSPCPLIRFYH
jgi:hypothetical protein